MKPSQGSAKGLPFFFMIPSTVARAVTFPHARTVAKTAGVREKAAFEVALRFVEQGPYIYTNNNLKKEEFSNDLVRKLQ